MMQTYFENNLSFIKEGLSGTGQQTSTPLLSHIFTPAGTTTSGDPGSGNNACWYTIDSQGGASSDYVNNISPTTNFRDGQMVGFRITSNARTITIMNNVSGTGAIILTADGNNIVLNNIQQFVLLKYNLSLNAFEEVRTPTNWSSPGAIGATTANTGAFTSLSLTTPLGASNGGTGVNAASAADGTLLIGNGSGFTLATLTHGSGISITTGAGSITISATGGTGTVTSFSSGNLSPLFATSVATSTTTPSLSFTLSNAGANTIFCNTSASSAAPGYSSLSVIAGTGLTGGGNLTTSPTISLSTPVSIADGGTGAATVVADSWFGNATGSTAAPAFNTSVFPNSLVNWAAPSAIGKTTPAAGTFTTLTLSTTPLAISSGGIGAATAAADSWFGNVTGSTAAPAFNTTPLPTTMGGTGSAAATNPSWFGCSGSTTPAFQSGQLPNSLVAWAAPGTIGSTTANTGAFSALSASSLTLTTPLSTSSGGLGVSAASAAKGAIPIGTGSGLALATITPGTGISVVNGSGSITIAATGGTVTSVSVGNLPPLFTASVATPTTTPAITFSLNNAAATSWFGNGTALSAAPAFNTTVIPPILLGNPCCMGRLYLVSGSPWADGSSSGNSTVYFGSVPNIGNQISLSDTALTLDLRNYPFSETSLALSGLTAGTDYDFYVYFNTGSGNVAIDTPVAWSNSTTPPARSIGADGRSYKSGDFTRLWVASGKAVSTTAIADWTGERFLSNVYNQVEKSLSAILTVTSFGVTSSTFASANSNTTDGQGRVSWIQCLANSPVKVRLAITGGNSAVPNSLFGAIGIGSTTTPSVRAAMYCTTANGVDGREVSWNAPPSVGDTYAQFLVAVSGGTGTFNVTASGQPETFMTGNINC
jgi:hypothetical protein